MNAVIFSGFQGLVNILWTPPLPTNTAWACAKPLRSYVQGLTRAPLKTLRVEAKPLAQYKSPRTRKSAVTSDLALRLVIHR